MDFNGMKLFLVHYEVEVSLYGDDGPDEPSRTSRIVFARDEAEAEAKITALYPSQEYAIYYQINFLSITEAIV